MKQIFRIVYIVVLFIMVCQKNLYADMGSIHPYGVELREDAQKAIIFYNYNEEILILGTNFKSDKKTTIVRFIPFPSEPKVSIVPFEPFKKVSDIISKKKIFFFSMSKGGGADVNPVQILFNAKLESHDITVIKINHISDFRNWVISFLSAKQLPTAGNLETVQSIAKDYIARGFNYFVFDIVEVEPEGKDIKPVAYRFKTDKLYYPLKTSNTIKKGGNIEIILISPSTICTPDFYNSIALYEEIKDPIQNCLPPLRGTGYESEWMDVSTSDFLNLDEISSIFPDAKELFKKENGAYLQVFRKWFYEFNFNDDIYIDISKSPRKAYNVDKNEGGPMWSPWWEREILEKLNKGKQ